jgi:hypothetical protein
MGQTKPTILCKSKAAEAFYFLETAARVGGGVYRGCGGVRLRDQSWVE